MIVKFSTLYFMPPRKKVAVAVEELDVSMDPVGDIYSNVKKCLEVKATMADVGRLYKMKDELGKIDWGSSDSLELKSMLISCIECKIFYKSAPGLNFLAIVFNLHPFMLPLINEVIKRCVLTFTHPQLTSCGQVLFKAWQQSSGGMRLLLEQFVTEWMRRALFTSTKTAERVRFLLSEFHGSRRTSEIDQLLSRFYGPILFRHTKVANWEVRFNAVALLCSAFPVMPPDRSAIEFEEKLTVQFRILKEAMEDPNESVRKVAVVGTGRILRDFWEVLTIEQIAMVLDTLSEKCGRDKKSVKTRVATIQSISLVMDNPLSHGVMCEILPNFCTALFNDESNLVRVGMAHFLLKLSRIASIRLADVVPQTNIFARLVVEHKDSFDTKSFQICEILAQIVAPSLFASSVEDQAIKCVRMAEMLPAGFLALTGHLKNSGIPELDRIRLAVALFKNGNRNVILLRASADLFRSASWAGVQGTEDKLDAESLKLCSFVYKHIIDRELAGKELTSEIIDVLSTLDGTRLPMTYVRIEKELRGTGAVDLTRIASVWGMYGEQGRWTKLLEACKTGKAVAGELAVPLAAMLTVALRLDDTSTMEKNADEMIKFLLQVAATLPGDLEHLIQLALACLLKLASRETTVLGSLTSVVHRINVGLFSSLLSAPSGRAMTEFIHFYQLFLIATNLLCSVPLSACKFEEIATIFWKWVDKESSPKDVFEKQSLVVSQCIAAQQGAPLCLSLVSTILGRVTSDSPSDAVLDQLMRDTVKEFVFTNEFNTIVTKLGLERGDKGVDRILASLAKLPDTMGITAA